MFSTHYFRGQHFAADYFASVGADVVVEADTGMARRHVLRTLIDIFDEAALAREAWVRRLAREEEELLWLLLSN